MALGAIQVLLEVHVRIPVQYLEGAESGDQGAAQSELQLPGVVLQVIAVPTPKDLDAQVSAS